MSGGKAHSAAACYVLLRREGKLYFVLRQNTSFMNGYYSLPAGRVELGESYAEGAAREASEEAGVEIAQSALQHVCTVHRLNQDGTTWTDVYFEAVAWQGEPYNAAPEEHSAGEWLTVSGLPENVMPYQHYAIDLIARGVTYGEYREQAIA